MKLSLTHKPERTPNIGFNVTGGEQVEQMNSSWDTLSSTVAMLALPPSCLPEQPSSRDFEPRISRFDAGRSIRVFTW